MVLSVLISNLLIFLIFIVFYLTRPRLKTRPGDFFAFFRVFERI